ncbi:MAG: MotA/TolQ/ExbB proton channel family protein [Treponema sp.]|nr:MotA/TolQ/ExbB proton channel family protein [Treponema sp.]
MIKTIISGGVLMVPILLCGIIATFIIVERLAYFIAARKRDARLLCSVRTALSAHNGAEAKTACEVAGTPCAQVLATALSAPHLDEAHLKELLQAKMDSVVPQLEHHLSALGTISHIATLLGLLGTVTGNIKAFGVLGGGGSMGNPALLASAIAEALVTTVGGLCISIPSFIFYNYFTSQVNKFIREMELAVTLVIFKLTGTDVPA